MGVLEEWPSRGSDPALQNPAYRPTDPVGSRRHPRPGAHPSRTPGRISNVSPMSYRVAALYQFVALPDAAALAAPLRQLAAGWSVKGTLILATEGLNGTIAGAPEAVEGFVAALRDGPLFGGRLDRLELKFSTAAAPPFRRLKVHLKPEIVTFGDPATNPAERAGTYVAASDWNALIASPDVLVIDTRNAFEVAMGTFEGALDPGLRRFGDFRDFVRRELDPARHRRVAMFCTGGIRCEKASAHLLAAGFAEVYHLKGGILRYLEDVAPAASRWTGACFVFDERIALGHGLVEHAPAACHRAEATAMTDDLAARVDALEMRIAYQDETIEDLNKTITAQWKEIDRLARELANLADRMREAEHRALAGAPPEPPPPHY